MARVKKNNQAETSNGANLRFEQKVGRATDKVGGHMDAGEYKHRAEVKIRPIGGLEPKQWAPEKEG